MLSQIEQFRAELDASPVRGKSPREFVEVRRDQRGEISVTIEPGTFRELTRDQLIAEIRAALVAAVTDYSKTSDRLFQRWGGAW